MPVSGHQVKELNGRGSSGESGKPDDERGKLEYVHLARGNLKNYIIRGIINEKFIPAFFSSIQKSPSSMGRGLAAITMSENGIRLVYDAKFFSDATEAQMDLVLSHELVHVLNMHFYRGGELMDELSISTIDFFSQYMPLADLPVNHSLRELPAYSGMKDNMLTYIKKSMEYDDYPTFESLVRWLHSLPQEKSDKVFALLGLQDSSGDNGESSDGSSTSVVLVKEDGSVEVLKPGSGKVVVIPEVTQEGKRECMKDVAEIVRSADRMAGSAPYSIRKAIDKFLDEYNQEVLKGWALLEHLLVGERAINKGTQRSYSRLNRRTRMLPGRKRITGFSAMFVVDESGSMSDEEVNIAFTLVKKVVLRENNDKVYLIHWDTEPTDKVEEIQYEADLEEIERSKCGGTDFSDFFRHEIFHRHEYDLYICVTDGYPYGGNMSGWPELEADKPMVWVITTSDGYENWKNSCGKGIAVCTADI